VGLFGSSKKILIQDPVFGTLKYMQSKDPEKGYFTGKVLFSPTGSEADLLIEADPAGPTESQREFYQNLQSNFDAYAEKMKPLIEDEFRNWKPDFAIRDFRNEFTLSCVSLPRPVSGPIRWELAFNTIHDRNHTVTIDFQDDEPRGILIDG
jgi:hypothetical protein